MRKCLLLNSTYEPLKVITWKKAVVMLWSEKAFAVEQSEDVLIRSVSLEIKMPIVLVLRNYRKIGKFVKFSRRNVLIRDDHICQYCGSKQQITVDHVFPKSRGGKTEWKNCVAACMRCNNTKSDKTPGEAGMFLKRPPSIPTYVGFQLKRNGYKNVPEKWKNYIIPGV